MDRPPTAAQRLVGPALPLRHLSTAPTRDLSKVTGKRKEMHTLIFAQASDVQSVYPAMYHGISVTSHGEVQVGQTKTIGLLRIIARR